MGKQEGSNMWLRNLCKGDDKDVKTMIIFFVVPAIPAIIFSCFRLLEFPPKTISDGIDVVTVVFFVAYFAGSTHMFILGGPAFWLGQRFDAIRWWTCIIAGFVIGGLPLAIFLQGAWEVFSWGVFGAIGGLAFWFLWRFWIRFDQPRKT
jgi:hypothetical protein